MYTWVGEVLVMEWYEIEKPSAAGQRLFQGCPRSVGGDSARVKQGRNKKCLAEGLSMGMSTEAT